MNTIKLYAVHNGYEIIGYASNFEEIKNMLVYITNNMIKIRII